MDHPNIRESQTIPNSDDRFFLRGGGGGGWHSPTKTIRDRQCLKIGPLPNLTKAGTEDTPRLRTSLIPMPRSRPTPEPPAAILSWPHIAQWMWMGWQP